MKYSPFLLLILFSISSIASDQATDYRNTINNQTTKYNLDNVKGQNIGGIYCNGDVDCINKMTNPEEKKYYTNSDSATEQVKKSQALIDAGQEAANDSIAMEIVNDRYNQAPTNINPDDFGFSRYSAVVDNADAIASGTGNKYIDCNTGDNFKYVETKQTCTVAKKVNKSCTVTPYISGYVDQSNKSISLIPYSKTTTYGCNGACASSTLFKVKFPENKIKIKKIRLRNNNGRVSSWVTQYFEGSFPMKNLPISINNGLFEFTNILFGESFKATDNKIYKIDKIDFIYDGKSPVLNYKSTCPWVTQPAYCKKTTSTCTKRGDKTIDGHLFKNICISETVNYSCGETKNTCTSLPNNSLPYEQWKEGDSSCKVVNDPPPYCNSTILGTCNSTVYTNLCTTKQNVGRSISCGKPIPCANGDCDTPVIDVQQTSFNEAASNIMALTALGQYMDEDGVTFFTGKEAQCSIKAAGFSNCCKESGWGQDVDLAQCSTEEKEIIIAKENKELIELGSYCAEKVLGVCIRKKRSFCQYTSKIAQILMEQGKPQLGLNFGSAKNPDCSGITIEQMQNINFDVLDFSNMYEDITSKYEDNMPSSDAIQKRIQNQVKSITEDN